MPLSPMARPLRRFRAIRDRALCGICVLLAAVALSGQTAPRARALGVPFGGTPGPLNAITDVPGVEVGHTTIVRGDGALVVGQGPVRTGVTAIWPRGKQWSPVFAGWFAGNGFGEMTGVRHAGNLDKTPAHWVLPSVPLGTHSAAWSAAA